MFGGRVVKRQIAVGNLRHFPSVEGFNGGELHYILPISGIGDKGGDPFLSIGTPMDSQSVGLLPMPCMYHM